MLKCLIIDDEPLAHKVIEQYILKMANLTTVGNCYNGFEAINFLYETEVDIIFLDINMPELSGLDMLKTMENKPAVILTTAYSEYALESYEYGVIDYLMKPIRFDRFVKAINKVLKSSALPKSPNPKATAVKEDKETFIFIKVDGVQHKVWLAEVNYIESKGNFIQFHLQDKRMLTAGTLSNMAKRLSPSGFLRVHKSYIINESKVDSLIGNQVKIGTDNLPIGNSYRQVVLNKIGL